MLTSSEILEIRHLVDNIRKWKISYYNGKPEVSDQVYDGAELRLSQLIPNHPVLSEVGTQADGFEEIDYVFQGAEKMLSLDKVHSVEEVMKFVDGRNYIAMAKLDGLSVRAVYESGKLLLAHTRGNGSIGNRCDSNFYFIGGAIPDGVNKFNKFEVRGEVCVETAVFKELNKERISRGEEPFSNERNCAAGSLKQLDFTETAGRNLVFLAYVLKVDGQPLMSKLQQLTELENMGFRTPRIKSPQALKGIKECVEETTKVRSNLPIQIDGIVFALDDVNVRESLGCTNHHPRYEVAYKFSSESGTTKLLDIEWNVTRTRKITPTGIIQPIELGGASLSRLTFNNAKWVHDKKIVVGEEIVIERANDVIPHFVKMVKDVQDIDKSKVYIPVNCPSCNSVLIRVGVDLVCPNLQCCGAAIESIKHYISKPVVNIDGVGGKLIDQLVESKLIKNAADLYTLTKEQLMPLDRMGERKAENVLSSIATVKKQTPRVFLLSLGIEALGKDVSEKIADFVDFETMEVTTDITTIDGIGDSTAKSVLDGLKEMKWFAEELKKHVTIESKQTVQLGNTLNGKSFCVSGHVELIFKNNDTYEDREAIQQLIKNYGGRAVSSVSKKLDFLVAGPGSGSKSDKANEYGVPIITGADLVKMMEG